MSELDLNSLTLELTLLITAPKKITTQRGQTTPAELRRLWTAYLESSRSQKEDFRSSQGEARMGLGKPPQEIPESLLVTAIVPA